MAKAAKAVAPVISESANLPATDYGDVFAGMATGLENVTSRDILIPRLVILQGLSPQVTMGNPEYKEEARVGQIYDTAFRQIFPKGITFLPVHFCEQFLEWTERGGKDAGLKGIHTDKSIMSKTSRREGDNRDWLPNGHYVQPTYQLYGYNVTAGWRKSYIPFAVTQRNTCQRINTEAMDERIPVGGGRTIPGCLYWRSRSMTTKPKSNAKGTWMIWEYNPGVILPEMREDWGDFARNDITPFLQSLIAGDVRGEVETMQDDFVGTTIDGEAVM